MISTLNYDEQIELQIDPNENGLPIMVIYIKRKTNIKFVFWLSKEGVNELIKELQTKSEEM